jgi:hypothetical protein
MRVPELKKANQISVRQATLMQMTAQTSMSSFAFSRFVPFWVDFIAIGK